MAHQEKSKAPTRQEPSKQPRRCYRHVSPLEQCWRDLRAAKYHPWTPETTLHQVGRLALGLPAEP